MAIVCSQCDRIFDTLQCGQSCNETWVARMAGWYKVKKSKKWYCLKCALSNQWEVTDLSEGDKQQYMCESCLAHTRRMYMADLAGYTQPSSSPSSTYVGPAYVGPDSQPMVCEPQANVHFMKPLRSLVGGHSSFALKYMQRACRCELEELNERARDRDAYQSGVRGLPFQVAPWSVKRREVVDESTGVSAKVISVPGLIAADERYPTKQEFKNKWRRSLNGIFVTGTLQAESSLPAAEHWRFDFLEQLLKFNNLQEQPLPQTLESLTLFQWNAGGTRQHLDVGSLRGGSLHFRSMQEVDAGIAASLERWGAVVHTHEPTIGQATCTFGRAAFVRQSVLLCSQVPTRPVTHHGEVIDTWLLSASQWPLLQKSSPTEGS